MDPVSFTLPEDILDNRGDFISHHHQAVPADDEPHKHKPSESPSKMSHENISRGGQLSPSEACPTLDESTSARISNVVEMLRKMSDSIPRPDSFCLPQSNSNQSPVPQLIHSPVPHLIPNFPGTTPPLIKTYSWPLIYLQTPSPSPMPHPSLTPVLPELLHTPSPPHYGCWMNMTPVASKPSPAFGYSPYALVPISPCLAPRPLFVLPEGRPSWCSCPHMMSAHPPCTPDLVPRETAQQVSKQFNVTPEVTAPGRKEQDIEWAKSEEDVHIQSKPDQDKLQASNTEDETETSDVSCGCQACLNEETLAELDFEDYMTVMESLCTKEKEKEAKVKEELEAEDSSIQEFLDRLCNDEELIKEFGLNTDLDSFLSSDPTPAGLVVPEKQEEKSHPPSEITNIEPLTEGKCLVESTLNTENWDCPLSSDSEPVDFLPLRQLHQESLKDVLEELLNPPSGDSNVVSSETEEKSLETFLVEAPDQRTHSSTQIDINPNHNGQTLFLEEPLPTDARPMHYNVKYQPCYDGSLFMDDGFTSYLEFFPEISSDNSLISELDARQSAASVQELSSFSPSRDLLQDSSTSISNLDDTEWDQTLQKLLVEPWTGDPPSYETPLSPSLSGSNGDPQTRPNLSCVSPPRSSNPLSSLVLTAMSQPPAQTNEPGEQRSSKTINPKSSHPEDYPVPVQANSSFLADSKAESSDPQVDANLSDSMPEKPTPETPKDREVSQEFASSGVSLEIKAGVSSEMERKCGETLGKGLGTAVTQVQMEAREEGETKEATEGKEENKENKCKGKTNTRRSQRLSGQIKKEEASLGKPIEENTGKRSQFTSEKDEKPRRRSSRGRQLHESKLGDLAEQLSEMGEQVQSQKFVEEIDGQRLSGQIGLGIPIMKSTEKTGKFTQEKDEKPRRRRSSRGKPPQERELGVFEEQSQATKTAEQASEMNHPKPAGEKEELKIETAEQASEMHHQKLAGEKEKLKVEDERQCEDNNPKVSPEIGAENALLNNIAQEEKELNKGTTEEDCIPRSNVIRSTRSTTKEERLHQGPRPEHAGWYNKQLEIKSSPKREMQDDKLEDTTQRQTLLLSSPMKRNKSSRDEEESLERDDDVDATGCKTKAVKVSEDCNPVSQPDSPLKCPRIQTNTPEEPPADGQSNKLSLVITCENNPHLSPIQSSETWQQDKTVASGGDDVMRSETWDFYSLRSGTSKSNVSKRTQDNKAPKMPHHQPNPEMSQDPTAGLKGGDERLNGGGDAGCLGLLSPTKRGASIERESGGHQREIIRLSPMKRGRWSIIIEANLDSDGVHDSTANETEEERSEDKEEVGTPGCKQSPTSSRSDTNNEQMAGVSRKETLKSGKCSAMTTRSSCKGNRIPHFPTKCRDFLLFKNKGHKRWLSKKKGKTERGKTLRSGRKIDN